MSAPDDPYASPPRDREAPSRPAPPVQRPHPPREPQQWWGPAGSPPAAGGGGSSGPAALAVGVLAVVLGVTIVGGVVLGLVAIGLGLRATAAARARGGRSRTAVAGIVLGVLGLLAAAGSWLYVRGDLADYQSCRRASVSFVQDRACEQQLRQGIEGS